MVLSAIVAVLALVAIQQAGEAPDLAFDTLGSATVPYVVAVILLVLTALALAEDLLSKTGARTDSVAGREAPDVPQGRWSVGTRTALGGAGLLVYVALLDYLDVPFWTLTWAYLFIVSRLIEGGRSRGRLVSLVVSGAVAVGIDVLFTRVLLIDLP